MAILESLAVNFIGYVAGGAGKKLINLFPEDKHSSYKPISNQRYSLEIIYKSYQ